MKKTVLLITALLICAAAATAQTASRWGITAGVNFNEIHFKQTDIVATSRMCGPQVGVTGEMNFSGIGFGAEASLLYTLKQGKVNYGERKMWQAVGAGNETVSMHYIDVPIHFKFKFNRMNGLENTIMPMAFFGPQFSFLPFASHKELNSYPAVNVYLDMGLGFELLERVQLRTGFNFSVGQSFHTKMLDDNVAKNRTWYVSATWFLK